MGAEPPAGKRTGGVFRGLRSDAAGLRGRGWAEGPETSQPPAPKGEGLW